jgi:hypothetical protein
MKFRVVEARNRRLRDTDRVRSSVEEAENDGDSDVTSAVDGAFDGRFSAVGDRTPGLKFCARSVTNAGCYVDGGPSR